MAVSTECVDPAGRKPEDVAAAVLQWLREQKKWLLVLDNLDDIGIPTRYE